MKTVLSIALALSLGALALQASAQGSGKQFDPYSQGAKAGDKFDPYSQGAKSGDKFDAYSQGMNQSTRADLAAEPAKPAKAVQPPKGSHTKSKKEEPAAKPES